MNRYTWKDPDGNYLICNESNIKRTVVYDDDLNIEHIYGGAAIDKLGRYEDLEEQGTNTVVVRCKDCDIPHNKWTGCPKLGGLVTPPDFYCAFGNPKV